MENSQTSHIRWFAGHSYRAMMNNVSRYILMDLIQKKQVLMP
jgi:hypothetical protein